MKAKLYVLGFVFLMFFACSRGDSYTLKGTFVEGNNGKFNGTQAVLATYDGKDYIHIDSISIENNAFTLKGDAKTIDVGFVICEGISRPVPFVMEKGNINIEIGDKGAKLTGTPANVAFQNMNIALHNQSIAYDKLMSTLRKLDASKRLSSERFASMNENIKSNKAESEAAVLKCIKANLDNSLAEYVLLNYNDKLSIEKTKEVLESLKNIRSADKVEKMKTIVDAKINAGVGKNYIDLTGENIKGKETKLSDFVGKNKLVLIDFWASWCPPCKEFVPALQKINKDYKDVTIVGVTLDDNKDAWTKVSKDLGVTWEQIATFKPKEISATYGVNLIPYMVIVDNQGIIKEAGHFEDIILEYKIKALLEQSKK